MDKLEIIKKEISAEMLKAGIINKKEEILDEKAFIKFIDKKTKECNDELNSLEENGAITRERNRVNVLFSTIEYLGEVKKHKHLSPYESNPEDIVDRQLKEKAEKKAKKAASKAKAKQFKEKDAALKTKSNGLKSKLAKLFGRSGK